MSQIRYVVASLPRSGTKYIATVLSKLGLNCGHETCFGHHRNVTTKEDGPEVFGDASWMAVPYIQSLPSDTIVFHQVRDPIKVLNSNLPPGGDSYFRTWDENAGLPADPLYKKSIPWKKFIWDNTQDWVWPDGVAEGEESPEEIERLIHWWMNWNLWIEYAALQRSDLQYIRYRLEDLKPNVLQSVSEVIAPGAVTLEDCETVVLKTSSTTNRHREPNTRITIDTLPPAARLMLYRYGYHD